MHGDVLWMVFLPYCPGQFLNLFPDSTNVLAEGPRIECGVAPTYLSE